jgi:hypothetical protein
MQISASWSSLERSIRSTRVGIPNQLWARYPGRSSPDCLQLLPATDRHLCHAVLGSTAGPIIELRSPIKKGATAVS